MLKTREDMKNYALSVCVPMLELAAERRLSRRPCEVVDTIGYIPTQLEELFRPFWGITPILNEQDVYLSIRGEKVLLGEWLRDVLVSGTDPDCEFYWDKNKQYFEWGFDFQNVTEIAGLLIGCFFAKEKTWDFMTADEQKQVADYIAAASIGQCAHIAGNNHVWFPLFCLLVLKKFGFEYPDTEHFFTEGLDKLDKMYISGGWYSDGAFGRIDYYEAWSMHSYPLLWCLIEDESFTGYAERRQTYTERTAEFLRDFAKFFDTNGAHPPFGRSLAYRFAASCVFPLAILAGVEFAPELAGEITRRNISYFEENLLTSENKILPPGYLYNSPALVDNYTSSGGPYWAAKTFLCLLLPDSHPFWNEAALPIDEGAYISRPKDERLNFVFAGEKHSGVTVYNNHFQYYQNGTYCNPFNDMACYYDKFAYNSRSGFAISTRDNTSRDNMICLSTRDGSMTSHRWGFVDLGRDGDVMISEHLPFSNDPETKIRTLMLPLSGSLHVRVHRVTLSREYLIGEGGFSLGLWDDYREAFECDGGFAVKDANHISFIKTVASVPFKYASRRPQPGLHMLAPFAIYPTYQTGALGAGEYIFASVFAVTELNHECALPELTLTDGCVKVVYNGSCREIKIGC